MEEMVNHPKHYQANGLEAIDVLEAFFPHSPLLWNAAKYLLRAGHKDNKVQDLRKAVWYIQREIEKES